MVALALMGRFYPSCRVACMLVDRVLVGAETYMTGGKGVRSFPG